MSNLFSSFDPMISLLNFSLSLNWISSIICIFMLPQLYWNMGSQLSKSYEMLMTYLKDELGAVFSSLSLPGSIPLFISLFFFIIFSNFMGLFPYIFTSTSHLVMTLTLSFPIWIGSMLWSICYQYNSLFAHLVPSGTPGVLMPVMVIIETVSNIIRPGTLAVRLAANMIAGHLLLTLLGSQGPMLSGFMIMGLMVGLILLIILELAVACIQSYVFTILSSLYLNELLSISFNKKMIK